MLDATIASLVEEGYAALTTRRVADRAGVTLGALQHHYPSKASLIEAALPRLAERLAAEVIADAPPAAWTERTRLVQVLDRLWSAYRLPLAVAATEYFNAGRTDPDVAQVAADLVTKVDEIAWQGLQRILPEYAARVGARDWMRVVFATLQGTVLLTSVPGMSQIVPAWPTVRHQLMSGLEALDC